MKISIIGISQIIDSVIDKIVNHSDDINVYSDKRHFDFENKYHNNKNIEIITNQALEDNIEYISNSSDFIFLLSESDPFNSFSYQKIINQEPNKKVQMLINDDEIYNMYKEKDYPVMSKLDLEQNDLSYLVKD
tara:strand:- start:273 stop:671 length:399 start_codon:yes stop_codon:yes gene_type:complete